MAADPRLRGQEVSIRFIADGALVEELNLIGSFNDNTNFALSEDGFLGETSNRVDMVLNTISGDCELQINTASWWNFVDLLERKARREGIHTINVTRTELYPNGTSALITYLDVSFGPLPQSVASRSDFVKPKLSFSCSRRQVDLNQL